MKKNCCAIVHEDEGKNALNATVLKINVYDLYVRLLIYLGHLQPTKSSTKLTT